MLGNDVVDLRDRDARPETFRPGFDRRVFSESERRAIAEDPNPLARRWAHWAAKEAAYKLARQIDPTFVFAPRRLIACYAPMASEGAEKRERRGSLLLEWPDIGLAPAPDSRPDSRPGKRREPLELELRTDESLERIHVIAAPARTDWGGVDFAVESLGREPQDPSAAVRELAIREIGQRLGVAVERLSIGGRGRIPTLGFDDAPTDLSLSLAHHGKWVGYAMGLESHSEKDERSLASQQPTRPSVVTRVRTA